MGPWARNLVLSTQQVRTPFWFHAERELPVLLIPAPKKKTKKIALTRENKKITKKAQKHPPKSTKKPKNTHKKHQICFFRAYARNYPPRVKKKNQLPFQPKWNETKKNPALVSRQKSGPSVHLRLRLALGARHDPPPFSSPPHLNRAPVGQGLLPPRAAPTYGAPTAGQGVWGFVVVGACQGTVLAGLCLIHHHHPSPPLTSPREPKPSALGRGTRKSEARGMAGWFISALAGPSGLATGMEPGFDLQV